MTTPPDSQAAILQKQISEIIAQLQPEIKRLNDHPSESSGNATLYLSLVDQIHKIKGGAFHPDVINALNIAVQKLERAIQQTKDHCLNRDILSHLQATNSELSRVKHVKG